MIAKKRASRSNARPATGNEVIRQWVPDRTAANAPLLGFDLVIKPRMALDWNNSYDLLQYLRCHRTLSER